MFARVSTYQLGPDSSGAPSEDTVNRVLQLPGCLGIYYLLGKDSKSLSITLWVDEQALAGRSTWTSIDRATTSPAVRA